MIAAHVESCIAAYQAAEDQERGESEEGSPPMGEDPEAFRAHEEPLLLRGLPVCSVVRGYDPRGEHQMEMVAGEEFALEWEQPFEEGGYWAWGWRLFHGDDGYTPLECGYVPLSHIKTKFGIKQPMLAASPKVSPAVESASPQPLAARCDVEVGLACKGPDALPGKLPTSTDEREIDGGPTSWSFRRGMSSPWSGSSRYRREATGPGAGLCRQRRDPGGHCLLDTCHVPTSS